MTDSETHLRRELARWRARALAAEAAERVRPP